MTQESPQEVERRIARNREEIDATINAIQERLSPSQILDEAMRYVRRNGSDVAANLGRKAKENPLPLLLTGVGIAWLISSSSSSRNKSSGRRRGYAVSSYYPTGYADFDQRAQEYENGSHPAIARAREAAESLQQRADESAESFQERVTEAKAKALDVSRRAGETAADFRRRIEDIMSGAMSGVSNAVSGAVSSARSGASHLAESASHLAHDARDRARRAGQSMSHSMAHVVESTRHTAERTREQAVSLFHEQPLIVIAAGIGLGTLLGALIPRTRLEDETLGEYGRTAKEKLKQAAQDVGSRAERVAAETAHAAVEAVDSTVRREVGGGRDAGGSREAGGGRDAGGREIGSSRDAGSGRETGTREVGNG